MSRDVIGVRIGRNAPILFVEAGEADNVVGDQVVIVLSDDGSNEHQASVVIDKGQMLNASVDKLAGRVLRNA